MWNLWTWEWQSPLIVHLVYFRPWTPSLMSFLRVSSDQILSYPISQMGKLDPRQIKQLGATINNLNVRIWVLDCPAAKCEFNSTSLLRGKKKRYYFSFSISKNFLKRRLQRMWTLENIKINHKYNKRVLSYYKNQINQWSEISLKIDFTSLHVCV